MCDRLWEAVWRSLLSRPGRTGLTSIGVSTATLNAPVYVSYTTGEQCAIMQRPRYLRRRHHLYVYASNCISAPRPADLA